MKQNYLWFKDSLSNEDSKSLNSQLHPSYLGKNSQSLREALGMFHWADTKEGHKYWHDVFMRTCYDITIPSPSVSENDVSMKDKGYDSSKRIIGYKAPHDLFQGRIKKGDIFSKSSSYKLIMYNEKHMSSGVVTEIVKTWEPVYEEKKSITLHIGLPITQVYLQRKDNQKVPTIYAAGKIIPHESIGEIQRQMSSQSHLTPWEVSFSNVKIGCSYFTKEDIDKVYNALEELTIKS